MAQVSNQQAITMFEFDEIDSIERFRQTSLKLVILFLGITLLILLILLVLPKSIVMQTGLGLSSILLLFIIMASLVFIAQFFVRYTHIFRKIASTLYVLLVLIFVLGAGSICLSLISENGVHLGSAVSITVFVAILWGTMIMIKTWVDAGTRLIGVYSELGL